MRLIQAFPLGQTENRGSDVLEFRDIFAGIHQGILSHLHQDLPAGEGAGGADVGGGEWQGGRVH